MEGSIPTSYEEIITLSKENMVAAGGGLGGWRALPHLTHLCVLYEW